jgi:hypothetical protein
MEVTDLGTAQRPPPLCRSPAMVAQFGKLGGAEPARVDREVNQDQVRPPALKPLCRALAAVGRAIVDHPEHALPAGSTKGTPSGSKRLRRRPRIPSIEATKDAPLQALRETGATGLEPATSGVTDRYELNRYGRLQP